MAKARTSWRCEQCGHVEPKWAGVCAECGAPGSFVEMAVTVSRAATSGGLPQSRPLPLSEVSSSGDLRFPTGIAELDRVLGGGLVAGSLVLLGGEPGIGKSTLLLQMADAVAKQRPNVIYACGEESPAQVKMRAERLGISSDISVLPATDVASIESAVLGSDDVLLVVDSIQTVCDPGITGAMGSVAQVREATARLMRLAKDHGVTTVIVGHVTKDGSIAGPRMLEHMVDTVLYFEGDRDHAFRVVRAVKNRFGPVSEIGVFEMGETGLVAVDDPSSAMLAHLPVGVSGSAVLATMEGSRPLLVEVQALVTPSYLQMPRRLANGVDAPRLLQVLAVLERRAGFSFGQHDVYVSVAGGIRVTEPGVDLALALALASARSDVALPPGVASFGELGLAGEVRQASNARLRVGEAAAAGLTSIISAPGDWNGVPIEVLVAPSLAEAVSLAGLSAQSRS